MVEKQHGKKKGPEIGPYPFPDAFLQLYKNQPSGISNRAYDHDYVISWLYVGLRLIPFMSYVSVRIWSSPFWHLLTSHCSYTIYSPFTHVHFDVYVTYLTHCHDCCKPLFQLLLAHKLICQEDFHYMWRRKLGNSAMWMRVYQERWHLSPKKWNKLVILLMR